MIVSAHQPDLLPYSGFWYKLAHSDIFELKIYDQYVHKGYQRRVRMRGSWATLPVHYKSSYDPINALTIDPDVVPAMLANYIRTRYVQAEFFPKYGPPLIEFIEAIKTDKLWVFNTELILHVRDLLGITTPLALSIPPEGRGSAGVISALQRFNTTTYLSGTGAKVYMDDSMDLFADAGIEVVFSPHKAVTGDSIIAVLMDYPDPLSVVMAEHALEQEGAPE